MSGIIRTSGEKIITRESYGNALAELGQRNEKIMVLDADLAAATKARIFKKVFPGHRIDRGITECSMMGIAAGPAATGMILFASSSAMFAVGRASGRVRNSIGYPHLDVKIGATHAGISVGEDGATHQCNEDIALIRIIPGIVVICPSDDVEVKAAARAATEYDGSIYLRFGRLAMPVINDREDYNFTIGKGMIPREGEDVTTVATNLPVSSTLGAAALFEKDGVDAEVINIHTIKPLDGELITASARRTGKMVTVEERSVIGGLESVVCSALYGSCPVPVRKIGMRGQFGESGPAMELIRKYGPDGEGIYAQVKEYLGR